MRLITVLFFLNAFALLPFTSVQALGRPQWKAILDVSVLPIYAVSALWLMRKWGINGAALAKLFVTILDFTVLYAFASKLKAFSIRDCFSGPLMRALLLSAALVAGVGGIAALHTKLVVSVVLLICAFIVYAIAFWIFAVDEEDRIMITNLWTKGFSVIQRKQAQPVVPILETDAEV